MLELAYIFLTACIFFVLNRAYIRHAYSFFPDKKSWAKHLSFPFLITLWLIYLILLSASGILTDDHLPPKILLFLFLPFALLTFFFYVSKKDSPFVQRIPLEWTHYFQSFRILVECLLLFTFYRKIIPVEATFEGYNFDILVGISSLLTGHFLKRAKYRKLFIAWNIWGILMILWVAFIIASSIYFPAFWGESKPMTDFVFIQIPFLFIPGFLAPLAIFIHVTALIQLRKTNNEFL